MTLWFSSQTKTYVKWLNAQLPAYERHLETLPNDLSDGVALHHVVHSVFGTPLSPALLPHKKATSRIERVANVELSLRLLRARMRDVPSAEDVVDAKSVAVLGLVWRLICAATTRHGSSDGDDDDDDDDDDGDGDGGEDDGDHGSSFDVRGDAAFKSSRATLLRWCGDTAALAVSNFSSDWTTAKPFVALVDALAPQQWAWKDRSSLDEAFAAAKATLGVAPLLDRADLTGSVDERIVMTYLSEFMRKQRDAATVATGLRDDDDDNNNNNNEVAIGRVNVRARDVHYARDPNSSPDSGSDDDKGTIMPNQGAATHYADAPVAPKLRQSVVVMERESSHGHASDYAAQHEAPSARGGWGDDVDDDHDKAGSGYGVQSAVAPSRQVQLEEEQAAAGYGTTGTRGVAPPYKPGSHYVDYEDSDDEDGGRRVDSLRKPHKSASTSAARVNPDVALECDSVVGEPVSRAQSVFIPPRGPPQVGSTARDHGAHKARQAETTVTVSSVTGHKMQPNITSMQFQDGAVVKVERYRDGRLVDENDAKAKKKATKKEKRIAAKTPAVQVQVRNLSGHSDSDDDNEVIVPLIEPNERLLACKCPSCYQKNRYKVGTKLVMCYSCRVTFRVPA